MVNLTLKNVPEALVERLRQRAQAHRRSLNREVLVCLEEALGPRAVDPEALLARVQALQADGALGRLTDAHIAAARAEGRP